MDTKGRALPGSWFIIPLLLITVLFAATQYSNANTHLTLLQKPGNYHDDSRLTNAIRDADSLGAVFEDLKWGYSIVVPAYYLNHFFEIETKGRRLLAASIIFTSLIYLLIILARYQVLDEFGLLVCAFLLAISGGLTVYASTGLLAYPLLIFISIIHLHLLLRYHDRPLSIKSYLIICAVFTLTALLNNRAVIGVCAVGFALSFATVFQNPVRLSDLLARFFRMAVLLVVPVSIVLLILYLYTPMELTHPYRGLEFYFFKSSFSHTLTGAVNFFAQNTAKLYLAAMSPHPLIASPAPPIWIGLLLGIFFLLGLTNYRNQKALSIALYFLAGTLALVILNLGTIAPYGKLRYFLPFFVAYPVLTAMGVTKITRKVGLKTAIYSISVIGMLLVLLQYQYANKQYNEEISDQLAQGVSMATLARQENKAVIVVDIWTADTLRAERWHVADEASYVLKTHIKTAWRGNLPENVDDISRWSGFLRNQESFIAITSVEFSQKYHGPLYKAAIEDFEIVKLPSAPLYHFAEFTRREDAIGR